MAWAAICSRVQLWERSNFDPPCLLLRPPLGGLVHKVIPLNAGLTTDKKKSVKSSRRIFIFNFLANLELVTVNAALSSELGFGIRVSDFMCRFP